MAEARLRRLLVLAGLTGAYFAAGRFGLSLAEVNESATAVWPPTGIAGATLLLVGTRVWPAVTAGAFLVNLTISGVVMSSIAIAAGNTLEALAAAHLTTRFARGRAAFDRSSDIGRFALCAVTASAIAASVGTASLMAAALARSADALPIWLTWWLGDAVGMILVAPLVLLWAAFRFGARETATSAVAASAIAITGTLRGFGPFARSSANESLLLLQSFVGVTTTVMLAVAAEVARRKATDAELRVLNDALERRVAARTRELVKVHDRLTEAQQVAHIGSWEWSVPDDTLWWSDELYRIYGIDQGAAPTYEAFLWHVHPADRAMIDGAVRQAMVDGRPFAFDHRIIRPDGTERILHAEGRVVMEDDRPVRMMGIGHDITERRRAEEAREQLIREQAARREAEDASRAKDRFLATLSHELRTPLNAALGWARLLLDLPGGDARAGRAAQAIYRNLGVQARLVSDIMDVSRAAVGTLTLERAPLDLGAVVQAAIETVREAASARGVSFHTTGADDPLPLVGDAQRLQQVIWNLLDNAVKFSGEGACIRIDVQQRRGEVEVAVADNGPGIAPAFLPHVFEEFRQADDSMTRAHGGLGLGLAIARRIVQQHGGTITAANRPEGGAIFTIALPSAATAVA